MATTIPVGARPSPRVTAPNAAAAASSSATAAAAAANRAAPATLEGAPINLVELRNRGRSELLDILQGARGRKALVLDTALRGLLGHIVPEGTKFLRQHGVVHLCRGLHTELSFLTPEGREDEPDHVLYFVRPSIANMRLVAAQIRRRSARRGAQPLRYELYFVPHRTYICEKVLEEEGVLGLLEAVGECSLDVFPLDTDVLSLELEHSFKDCYVDEDTTMLTTVAKSLQKLEAIFGTIPNVKAKGPNAAVALQRFLALKKQAATDRMGGNGSSGYDLASPAGGQQQQQQPEIDTLVILDRAVDLVTPLLTPLTYEGIVDEAIGIQHGAIKVDPALVGDDAKDAPGAGGGAAKAKAAPSSKDPVTVALNSNDPLYAEIRDLHLEVLGATLNEKAMEMRQTYARVKEETRDGSLNEIHDVVRSIPALQQKYRGLNLHINVAEFLKPTTGNVRFQQRWQLERSMVEGEARYDDLEDLVAAYEPVNQVLRLLCLQSLTGGGIKASKYEALKREVIQSYGYEYLFALGNMEQAGLLRKADMGLVGFGTSGGAWSSLRRTLRLVKENVNTQNPDDIAYVSSGYAPLSVRLLQLCHKPGWAGCPDVMRQLPGPTLEFTQQAGPAGLAGTIGVLQELDRLLAPSTAAVSGASGASSSSSSTGAGAAAGGPAGASGGAAAARTTSPLPTSLLFSMGSTGSSSSSVSTPGIGGGGGGGSFFQSASSLTGGQKQQQQAAVAAGAGGEGKTLPNGRKVLLAYFVGGVSFMEIAALRHLSRQRDFPYQVVVCTTKLINGNSLVQSTVERIENNLAVGPGPGGQGQQMTPR